GATESASRAGSAGAPNRGGRRPVRPRPPRAGSAPPLAAVASCPRRGCRRSSATAPGAPRSLACGRRSRLVLRCSTAADAGLPGLDDRLRPIDDLDLREDTRDVVPDRLDREDELRRDLPVRP